LKTLVSMREQEINIDKIKNTYRKTYRFFFKYFIYFVILILWIIKIISIFFNKDIVLENSEDFMVEKIRLVWEFNKTTKIQTNDSNIKIHILNWNLENDKNLLISNDNLISYNWIILPKNTFIYQTQLLKNLEYFKNDNYDVSELENLAKNTIFINLDQIEEPTRQYTALPLKENIENTFYIKCIKQKKIFDRVCNKYVDNFLNNFYIYNIDKDYNWLEEIFQLLYKTKHKTNFCNGMLKYISYSNDTNDRLESIFTKCWKEYLQNFQDFKSFLEIQEQLKNGYINSIIYDNFKLNEYKLISFQQIIYSDLHQNIVNNIRINSYFDYLSNLLKNNNKIDPFYLDLSYWFNNNYILDTLNKNKHRFTEIKKSEIENTIKNLNLINNGWLLEWHNWLKKIISNKNLEDSQNENTIETEKETKLDLILKNIKSLSFLKIINEKILDEKLKISWYFLVKTKEDYLPIYLWFSLNNEWILTSININEYSDLNETIEKIIQQKQYSISDTYQYIQNNINLFISNDNISTCDLINNRLENYKNSNKQINQLNLTHCDQNSINIFKEEKENNEIYKIFYKITLNNFNINKVQISNNKLENEIEEYLKNIETNNITIATVIHEIVSYKDNNINLKQEWTNNIIIAIEDFQNYLQIIPTDISEEKWKIFIEFKIKNINLIWTYDINEKMLYSLSFKYKENNNNIAPQDLFIKNFHLLLTDNHKNEINKFMINPKNYISNVDKSSVENYEQLQ